MTALHVLGAGTLACWVFTFYFIVRWKGDGVENMFLASVAWTICLAIVAVTS